MSNILDIPQIAVFDPGNLQNDLHIGFTGDLKKQRLEKDRQRDVLWKEIKKTVDTFATLTIFPDKKALKAGGLLLALAGTPVQPADEVDAEKEYELVALA